LPFPKSLSLTWEAKEGVGYLVVSPDETLGLAPFASSSRLASSPWLTQRQPGLAEGSALSVLFDVNLIAPGGPDGAKVLVSFGEKEGRIVVAMDAAAPALPALAQLFALHRSP
jgi:hypothetical protein